MIIWITGLSGAGKTSIGQETVRQLQAQQVPAVLVDGDAVRWVVQDPHIGHDRESRLTNAYRICRFAKLLEEQGLVVVVATMSLFHEIHAWNRTHFADYREVLVQVPAEVLQRRDARGLYSRLQQGTTQHVAGFDLEIEMPQAPHLVLNNHDEATSFEGFARQILAVWQQFPEPK